MLQGRLPQAPMHAVRLGQAKHVGVQLVREVAHLTIRVEHVLKVIADILQIDQDQTSLNRNAQDDVQDSKGAGDQTEEEQHSSRQAESRTRHDTVDQAAERTHKSELKQLEQTQVTDGRFVHVQIDTEQQDD
jgi:hypothetical protein